VVLPKPLYERLDQRCTGMEFATEMIIKASLHGEKIAEVPHHSAPRRTHIARATFENISGWLAHVSLFLNM
jgi:hypothetical protein